MASRIGRTILSRWSLRAERIPSGTPISAQKNTEVSTSDKVVIASDQTPIRPNRVRVMAHNQPMRAPATCQPSSADKRMPIDGGMVCRMYSKPLRT
ncbi:hypothetical protein D3C85_1044190 [compost metagenome]